MISLKKAFLLILIILNTPYIISMGIEHHLVIIPGQNTLGGGNTKYVLPQFTQDNKNIAPTPYWLPDLGQNRCITDLEKTINPLLSDFTTTTIIGHASSQGTATICNFYANTAKKVTVEEKVTTLPSGTKVRGTTKKAKSLKDFYLDIKKIKALILESILLTGNSAITHTVTHDKPFVSKIPFHYYWLPYLAKILFPSYQPAGQHAIFSVDALPPDLPIIIMHGKHDKQLSFKDSQALYAYLRTKNHTNIYWLPIDKNDTRHVELLEKNDSEIKIINAILHKHNLPYSGDSQELANIDLNPYQPKSQPEWLEHFNDLRTKEERIWYIDWSIKGIIFTLFCYILYTKSIGTYFTHQISL